MNIVLFGFKTCGKSSVGVRLAHLLAKTFIDVDDVMEALYYHPAAGRPVMLSNREIFEEHGELFFRALEREAVSKLRLIHEGVIATGGGAVLDFKNYELLTKDGVLVYLKTDKEALRERLFNQEEIPAILGEDPEKAFEKMYAERIPVYERIADVVIDTAGMTPQEIAEHFLQLEIV